MRTVKDRRGFGAVSQPRGRVWMRLATGQDGTDLVPLSFHIPACAPLRRRDRIAASGRWRGDQELKAVNYLGGRRGPRLARHRSKFACAPARFSVTWQSRARRDEIAPGIRDLIRESQMSLILDGKVQGFLQARRSLSRLSDLCIMCAGVKLFLFLS